MINVIIFGIAGNRQKIERILEDDVNICGYTDVGPHFENISVNEFESKPFIPMAALRECNFDYIVVCCESQQGYLFCEKILEENGISLERIVPTWMLTFTESVFQNTYLEYLERDKEYEAVVFGASTTRYGLISDLLGVDCFKFSLNGMDLHGIELFVSNLLIESPHFSATKTVIIDFTYFIFNLDNCSTRQGQNLLRRMAIYEPFGDWGHYLNHKESDIRFRQYKALKKLFSHKYEKIISSKSNNYMSCEVFDEEANNVLAHGVWTKIYADTINENMVRFDRILHMIKSIGAKVFVVVYPLDAKFVKDNYFIIGKQKKMFYKRMDQFKKNYDISVLDFNELYDFPGNYFYDVTHMNYCGALNMTQLIREKIFEGFHKQSGNGIYYSVKLKDWGWTRKEKNGRICGISGDYSGITGIMIENDEMKLSLTYRIHSLHGGWSEVAMQGNAVEFQRDPINAICINKEDGDESLDLLYKTYVLGHGWTEWSENGEESGIADENVIITAIIIELMGKNE